MLLIQNSQRVDPTSTTITLGIEIKIVLAKRGVFIRFFALNDGGSVYGPLFSYDWPVPIKTRPTTIVSRPISFRTTTITPITKSNVAVVVNHPVYVEPDLMWLNAMIVARIQQRLCD